MHSHYKEGLLRFSSIIKNILLLQTLLFTLHAELLDPEKSPNKWTISADFLTWFASEEVASIWADITTVQSNATSLKLPGFDFQWDYGFRIGAGRNLEHDQWDTAFYWSWFRTDAKHAQPSQPNTSLSAEFDAAFLAQLTEVSSPQSMSVQWSLLFNMFHWELGKSYWASKHISIRPFLGLQGGEINQSIEAKYYDLIVDIFFPTNNSAKERLKNDFWGIGPLGGLNTQWRLCQLTSSAFDLFSHFAVATMWGNWTCSDVYKNTLSQSYSVKTENNALGALMFRGFLGIGWNVDLYQGKSHFLAKIGYETQIWTNQLRIATFQIQRLHHDLTLQGITINAQFDF